MTRRIGWLLLNLATGLAALPGCAALRGGSPAHDYRAPVEKVAAAGTAGFATAEPVEEKPVAVAVQKPPTTQQRLSASPPTEDPAPVIPATAPKTVVPAGHDTAVPAVKAVKRSPLVEALQCMLDDRHQEALQHLQAYDPETQEFFLGVLPTLTLFTKKRLQELSTQEVAVLYDQFQSSMVKLRPRTELLIEKMCFCEKVSGFGVYQPRAARPFLASTPSRPGDQVQVYLELKNFASEKAASGLFETRLKVSGEILDADGKPVAPALVWMTGEEPLRSRTRLHDYYNSYVFYVPVVAPGNYQLVLRVVDLTTPDHPRETTKALDFRVTAIPPR